MNDAKDRLTIGITVVRLLEYGGLLRIHLYAHEPNPLPQSLIDHIAGHAVIMRAGRLSGHRMLVDLSSSLDYSIAHELFAEWCVGWHIRQSLQRQLRIQFTYPTISTRLYDVDGQLVE